MNGFPSRETVERVRRQYPSGTRVELVRMDDIQAPPAGTLGTVLGVDDTGSLLMKWDNGRSLSLMLFDDNFTVIPQEQEPTADEQLYDKLRREQQSYTRELLTLPPSKIPEKAWEYLVREDILLTMEYKTLEDEHVGSAGYHDSPLRRGQGPGYPASGHYHARDREEGQ